MCFFKIHSTKVGKKWKNNLLQFLNNLKIIISLYKMNNALDSDCKAVLVKSDNDSLNDVSHEASYYYLLPRESRRKKQCGSCCCCLALFTFIIFLIFIPKTPDIYLNKLYYNAGGIDQADFIFKNKNFYNMEWKNPDISLYWIPYDGQSVGSVCYGENGKPCESEFYHYNICAIKIGEFESNLRFKTNSRSTTNKNIDMLSSSQQEAACAAWMVLNPYRNKKQRLITSGSVHAKGGLTHFKKIKVSDEYYYLQ